MEKVSLESELAELRAQVALLSEREASRDEAEESADEAGLPEDEDKLSVLRTKIEEFMDTIQSDLREIPATTAIGIFALGVLVGRLLPR